MPQSFEQALNEFSLRLKNLYPATEIAGFLNLLCPEIIGLSRAGCVLRKQEVLPKEKQTRLREIATRLSLYEPLQYILGKAWFAGLELNVSPAVLIPRPETEELAHWIAQTYPKPAQELRILDIGTGSGCLAVLLSKQLNAQVFALDVSAQALEIARQNAEKYQQNIVFFQHNILKNKPVKLSPLDVVVSNPPYVRPCEKKQMPKNVTRHEPHKALFVPENDPLIFYRKILSFSRMHLKPGGRIFFEINEFLKKDLKNWLENEKSTHFAFRKDIHGKNRMLCIEPKI